MQGIFSTAHDKNSVENRFNFEGLLIVEMEISGQVHAVFYDQQP